MIDPAKDQWLKKLIIDLCCLQAEGRILMAVHLNRTDEDKIFGLMTKENQLKSAEPYAYSHRLSPLVTRLVNDACNMIPIKWLDFVVLKRSMRTFKYD